MRFFTKTELRIFLIFWMIFSIFATGDRWNDNSSLDLTMAIVNEHRFEIDSYANNTGDRAYYNGHYYSDKVPGTAFLATPLYIVYKIFIGNIPPHNNSNKENPSLKYHLFLFLAISLISSVCGALTIVLVYKISKYFTSNNFHRNLIVIILGLGTLLLHAARQFNSHAISTFFIFLSFYLIFKMKKKKKDYALFAGLAGGFAVLTEYRILIILTGIFIMVLLIKKPIIILKFSAGVIVFIAVLVGYNYFITGNPFNEIMSHPDVKSIGIDNLDFFICDNSILHLYKNMSSINFLLPSPLISIKQFNFTFNRIWKEKRVMRVLFDPFKGLFFYSPILIFSLLGLVWMYRDYKMETLIIAICFTLYVLHLASETIWWKGPSFGPRHLTPIIPFLAIPLLYAFKKINLKFVLFFAIISILIGLMGLQSVVWSHDNFVFSSSYCKKMQSYAPLANPLFKNYLPHILEYPPYNPEKLQDFLVLERILAFKIVPFANIILLLIAFLLIWKNKYIFKD